MCDPEETAAKALGESVGKILESEAAKNLLCPVTNELGLALGEIGIAFRFYVSENLNKGLQEMGLPATRPTHQSGTVSTGAPASSRCFFTE